MLLDVSLALEWESGTPRGTVRHRDCLFAGGVDPVRDALPGALAAQLADLAIGESVVQPVSAAALTGCAVGAVFDLPAEALRNPHALGSAGKPFAGRFYPSTVFALPEERQARQTIPVRYLGTEGGMMRLDSRHPLTGHDLQLTATVICRTDGSSVDRPPTDWGRWLATGPGMQACWRGRATAFIHDGAYARSDDAADRKFYDMPRITAHIDSRAQQTVGDYYAGYIPSEGDVLDLMSSAHSNLHPEQRFGSLTGLGMNAAELAANARLTDSVVADLNTEPTLPFADARFDAAICTVSIDYLTDPVRVIGEVGRVLRPGAPFAITFSNRWFPPKVTRLWTELSPFEQIGLVVSYFEATGRFDKLETASFRGLPRPLDDPYAGQTNESDPVFAVTGFARR
ncbi:MAG: class I SAM-dependent methyltransferase [Alphaproteobacteria bacterium]